MRIKIYKTPVLLKGIPDEIKIWVPKRFIQELIEADSLTYAQFRKSQSEIAKFQKKKYEIEHLLSLVERLSLKYS